MWNYVELERPERPTSGCFVFRVDITTLQLDSVQRVAPLGVPMSTGSHFKSDAYSYQGIMKESNAKQGRSHPFA
jgi:hypothetical protein